MAGAHRDSGGLDPKPILIGVDFDRNQLDTAIFGVGISGLSRAARMQALEKKRELDRRPLPAEIVM